MYQAYMAENTPPRASKGKTTKAREDRLKAALKSNLARRKAQAKARAGDKQAAAEAKGQDDG